MWRARIWAVASQLPEEVVTKCSLHRGGQAYPQFASMKAIIKLINGGPMCIPAFDKLICFEAAHAQSKGMTRGYRQCDGQSLPRGFAGTWKSSPSSANS